MLQKEDFPLRSDVIFLNHGSFGACPYVLLDKQRQWQLRLERQPVEFHRDLAGLMKTAREKLATFVGAQASDLVYVANSTYGVNVAANALRSILEEGDQVLMTDHEYGACDRAWQIHLEGTGAEIVRVPVSMPAPSMAEMEEQIWAAVTDKTRILYLSHITSPTAIRLPIEALCKRARERGILTVIDGAHAPGQIDLDLGSLGADVYTANCHKWMCTPKGSAFLWVNPELHDNFGPLVVSWGAMMGETGDGVFVDDHEYLGTRDPSPFLTVGDAISWMQDIGWSELRERSRRLRDECMRLLTEDNGLVATSDWQGNELQMGAVLLPEDVSVEKLKQTLYDDFSIEVVVLSWLDRPILRFSVHAHTTSEDLEALSKALAATL